MRKIALVVGVLLLIMAMGLTNALMHGEVELPKSANESGLLFILALELSGGAWLIRKWLDLGRSAEIDQRSDKATALQKEAASGDLTSSLRKNLESAIAREEVRMLRAENRSNQLYRSGSTLLFGSVLCPIMAALLYSMLDPLPQTQMERIAMLHETLGGLPESFALQLNRDWRVLLGGVTFGFLCLAAAGSLLKQRAREVRRYSELEERAQYFQRGLSALNLRLMMDEKPEEVAPFVIDHLLAANTGQLVSADSEDDRSATSDHAGLLKTAIQAGRD